MLNESAIAPPEPNQLMLNQAMTEFDLFLKNPSRNLSDFLSSIVLGGGLGLFKLPFTALPVFRTAHTSGYNYAFQHKMFAYLRFGVTESGYFVIQTLMLNQNSDWISHYYSADGSFAFTEGPISHRFAIHPETMMERNCPILSHLYDILASEYSKASLGGIDTKSIHTIEKFLQKTARIRKQEMSLTRAFRDASIAELNTRMMEIDLDPVYTWKERHTIIKNLKSDRAQIIKTKRRAHRMSLWSYSLPIFFYDGLAAGARFLKRPLSSSVGVLDRMLIDPLRWFVKVVRNNMGYSIALAIYSPFTFFFITQPMNPHATWAVGKVRSAYIEMTDKMKAITDGFGDKPLAVGTVTPGAAAIANTNHGSENTTAVDAARPANASTANTFGLPLSTDIPAVNDQSWDERMSNFKAMQISYESNMESAPRMGRLEQMETQLNWPLIVESSWLETERYLEFLNFIEANAKDYLPPFVLFVKAEKERTEQIQFYLWDRNIRFILDHPFTMMDQGNEQTQADYYVGRSFILLRDMTNTLANRNRGLAMPADYEKITQLAQKFESEYKNGGSVLERLKNNSKLFAQYDPQSTKELRSYMKRQWEILYLLQNHAQEGANTALQMYIWSVRNAVWVLQSLNSAKREEMSLLSLSFKKNAIVNKLTTHPTFKRVDSQYEALFHMMLLEYTSIRKEIGEELKNDIEATQRKKIIHNVEKFLKERDELLKGAKLL